MRAAMILWDCFQAEETARKGAAALSSFTDAGWETELWLVEEDNQKKGDDGCWRYGLTEEVWMYEMPYNTVLMLSGMGDPFCCPKQYKLECQKLIQEKNIDMLLLPETEKGRELAAALSVILHGEFASSVTNVCLQDQDILYERRIYSCNLNGTFQVFKRPFIATIDKNAYEAIDRKGCPQYEKWAATTKKVKSFICCEAHELPQTDQLDQAERILISGRGGVSALPQIEKLAGLIDAKVGGTRPTVLEGHVPYSSMIGMTGTIVKPKLCIALGVSGAAPFMIGVRDSHVIVAVNNDEEAAIFRNCDIGVVDDVHTFLELFLQVLEEKEDVHE